MKNETYRELLTRFNENFEGIHRVLVAFEVQNYLQSFEIKLSEEDFEDLCETIYWIYIKSEGYTIEDIVSTVTDMFIDEKIPLEDIDKHDVFEVIDNSYL